MTKDEADTLIEGFEEEMRNRLPEGVGACFFLFDKEAGIHYTSNVERALVIAMIKQFITRNTQ